MTHSIEVRGGEAPADRSTQPLGNAVWAALNGPHARFAERLGSAARYPADVYDFAALAALAALADPTDPAAWADLREPVDPGAAVRLKRVDDVPCGGDVVGGGPGVQLVETALRAEPAPEAVGLGPDDVLVRSPGRPREVRAL
ncbi:hypothetical protein SAMN06272771_0072 [Streptomyces sp. Ag82_O1-12]|nr:hypothetical protein SAMN06272771_0072 [Streptomyces sp. Ag82_O1-12]SOD42830.1 hypothetical protein SAMN06272727_0062 [Streptomyces sp. Ag82_G6-1]